jgi:hypothetical protein
MSNEWQGPPPYSVHGLTKRVPDFVGWHTAAPVVSERIVHLLDDVQEGGFETLPFGHLKGQQVFAINVLSVYDCVDFSRSDIQFYGDSDYGIPKRIELLPNSIHMLNGFFKMARLLGFVFVSDDVAKRLVDAKSTGLGLTRLHTDVLARVLKGAPPNDHPGLQ